ncbi:MAG: hypothetical protein QM703_17320 [Gemmatales bacterium]
MPEPKQVLIYFEGDDDGAFLKPLLEANILPSFCKLAVRDKSKHAGKDGLVGQIIPFVSPVNGVDGKAIVLIDLDEQTVEQQVEWFHQQLRKGISQHPQIAIQRTQVSERLTRITISADDRSGHVAIVSVGCPHEVEFNNRFGIDRFAIDDWVFRLTLDQVVYDEVSDFRNVPFEVASKKYQEVAALFRQNGLEVRKAKSYLQILRAVCGIRPSTATIIGNIVKKAIAKHGNDGLIDRLKPLIHDLQQAADQLKEL